MYTLCEFNCIVYTRTVHFYLLVIFENTFTYIEERVYWTPSQLCNCIVYSFIFSLSCFSSLISAQHTRLHSEREFYSVCVCVYLCTINCICCCCCCRHNITNGLLFEAPPHQFCIRQLRRMVCIEITTTTIVRGMCASANVCARHTQWWVIASNMYVCTPQLKVW